MVDYIAPTEAETDAGQPQTESLWKKVAFNPLAIAEGAAGAPRILDAALSTTATDTGRSWVADRIARMQLAGLGTYALLAPITGGGVLPGAVQSGSNLQYASAGGGVTGTAGSGSWRCMGLSEGASADGARVTLWLRIA